MKKKRMYSAIKPTGLPTLGNYLGAMRNWETFLNEYDCIYAVADFHAITVRMEPKLLERQSFELYAILMACGLVPERCVLYLQSHVQQHAELSWILNCYSMFGEMSRMTQFKDKSAKAPENVNVGLFSYPVLMAADILLYDADFVPVGQDQKQHVEITRNIAGRFNGIYGKVFVEPEPLIPKLGAKIQSLLDPSKKMDKSDPLEGAYISLTDGRDAIVKKFKRAVTDSESDIRFDAESKPGVSNLLTIFALCTGKTIGEAESFFAGRGYGALKTETADAVDAALCPIREKTAEYMSDPAQLILMMREGADRVGTIAGEVLTRVKKAVGFVV